MRSRDLGTARQQHFIRDGGDRRGGADPWALGGARRPVLSLVGGHVSLLTPGLLLLALARTGTRGPIGYIDWTVRAVGIALLLLSAMQPIAPRYAK